MKLARAFLVAIALAAAPTMAFAAKPETYVKKGEDAALGGYDPVSYFANAPAKGLAQYSASYKGATFRFASADNLAKFKADPAKYAPQYGGYCAWAAARNYTAPGSPAHWKIVNGKLYLNYNGDIQKKWEKDIPGFIAKVDGNWPSVLSK